MHVEVIDLILVGFGLIILYLVWESQSLDSDLEDATKQLNHLIQQHTNLCEVVEHLAEDVEQEMDKLEERLTSK